MASLDTDPPSIEQIGLFSTIESMQQRLMRLQREVDRYCEQETSDIFASSAADVVQLRDKYNKDWFRQCLYSPAVKAKIAQRLLDAVKGYEFVIDVSVWNKIAGDSK